MPKGVNWGREGGFQLGHSRCLGWGQDLELSLPLLRSVWQDRSISTPRARRSNSDSPLHFPSVQKQGEWASALVCGTHPPSHPTHQIWSEWKKAVPRRAFQPRNVARTARRGTGSRPVLPWQLPPCAGSKHPMGKSELAAPASPPLSRAGGGELDAKTTWSDSGTPSSIPDPDISNALWHLLDTEDTLAPQLCPKAEWQGWDCRCNEN